MVKNIAVICALPQESRPIINKLGNPPKKHISNIPTWNVKSAKLHVTIAEAGIGMTRAAEAVKAIIKATNPDIIISTGFCGAVRPGLQRGDIVLAEKLVTYTTDLLSSAISPDISLLEHLSSPGKIIFHRVTCITTNEMVAKSHIAAILTDQTTNPVLEMESHAIAEVCNSHNIPFAAIRAVTDTAEEDPQPVCCKIFNADMEIRRLNLLKMVIASPRLVRQLLQLHLNSKKAGNSLAQAIELSLERLQ